MHKGSSVIKENVSSDSLNGKKAGMNKAGRKSTRRMGKRAKQETQHVTIIIPAFNEEAGISTTLKQLLPFAQKHKWQIIVINDGSFDKTASVLASIEHIKVINHSQNRGYGAALKTGIRNASGDLIVLYDADGQHRPEDVERLLDGMEGSDMVVGQRGNDSHQDWIRKPGKWILSKVANYLTGRKIPDLNSGLRVVKRNIIMKVLHLMPDGFSFSTTSTIAFMNMGFGVNYQPIKVNKRIGTSSVRQLKHGSNTLLLILRLVVLFNPLKVFIPLSLGTFAVGFFYEILYGIILHPLGPKLIPAAFFLILSSLLFFFFGLVVDQVSEMRKHLYFRDEQNYPESHL